LQHPEFRAGTYDTGFLARNLNRDTLRGFSADASLPAAVLAAWISHEHRDGESLQLAATLPAKRPSGWKSQRLPAMRGGRT
jgi:hypothetical protein